MDIELIHADSRFTELRQITEFRQFDAVVSADPDTQSDWMLEMPAKSWQLNPILAGHYVYISSSEWGGPVERVRHSTSDETVRVYGTCWRGLLARRAICPNEGETHAVYADADANDILRSMTAGWMTGVMAVYEGESGLKCSGKIRYRNMLDAVQYLFEPAGAGLRVRFTDGRVMLWAESANDYSEDIELSQEYECSLISERKTGQYNHIIALGQGEMLERTIVQLWLLPDGSTTENRSAVGVPVPDKYHTLIYDYTAAETRESLVLYAAEKLKEHAGGDSMEIVVEGMGRELELNDRISVRDKLTGMLSVLNVSEKNLNISSAGMSVRHTLK